MSPGFGRFIPNWLACQWFLFYSFWFVIFFVFLLFLTIGPCKFQLVLEAYYLTAHINVILSFFSFRILALVYEAVGFQSTVSLSKGERERERESLRERDFLPFM